MDEELMALCEELQKDLADLKIALVLMLDHTRQNVWMNSYQVQTCLNISRFTLRRYRELNKIRFITFRGRYRYLNKDVNKLKYLDNKNDL